MVNTSRRVVLDGGGKVTLSGGGKRRILYQNTCDQRQTWTTSHCDDQATPRLVVQNLTFADGNSTGETYEGGGGGAIFVARRPAQDRALDGSPATAATGRARTSAAAPCGRSSSTTASRCTSSAAPSRAAVCSNGAALSSIGVSWSIYNSVFTGNRAIGRGANPARPGTPGGGSGGAIYTDGNDFRVLLAGTLMTRNHAREGGGAIFFVSNDRTGDARDPLLDAAGQPERRLRELDPGIFFLGRKQTIER